MRILTRRVALRALFTIGVVAGTAGVLAPVVSRRPGTGSPGTDAASGSELERFTEMYRGRRIEGAATYMVPAGSGGEVSAAAKGLPSVEVRIDGRPLHVMRRADGSYLSLVNHYESFPTLRDVARAAVDELGAEQLALSPAHSPLSSSST
ncbi:tyrosinase family oxidase copper chaperone [Streptomyces sp. NBC_00306]|uniref:tyrosinase family oxidase copper chaperone n=1 Tax=Streptomyces sp. NBC_00306 TaxID=2975708 RepID=UPI002E295011|nr:tyrosinase family oxidase copper chaperone [Streptomyces sp. NBC_00306]